VNDKDHRFQTVNPLVILRDAGGKGYKMSKQSEAKERQGYNPNPTQEICSTCNNFLIGMDWPAWMKDGKHDNYLTPEHQRETNLRCGLGGFAVKNTARCNEWAVKG
jgi:hypothetical protein